jgi:hypothetical protein
MGKCSAAAVAVTIAALVVTQPAFGADRESRQRVVAVDGVAKARHDLRVEILVVVPAGDSARLAGDRALDSQAATRAPDATSSGYTFNGLFWEQLPVVQSYNPSGQPTPAAGAALTNTYSTWSSIPGSRYRITSGGTTNRCPSLVRGCPGGQRFDGFNDVGWSRLSGGTLGVTWYSSSIDEADMALNVRYAWSTACTQLPGAFDAQTVFLHENGHVAGLGHSSDPNAVMYPSYVTAHCTLGQDDKNGLAALY